MILLIIFLLAAASIIYLLGAIFNEAIRFLGHSIIMAGGKITKVKGMNPRLFYLLPLPVTYVVWYLLIF